MSLHRSLLVPLLLLCFSLPSASKEFEKKQSAFYPPILVEALQKNLARHDWAKAARDQMVQKAEPWMEFSDDQLWNLMFGPTISGSWMVWSDGYCPACKESVPMYNWEVDALGQPWKVQCPHCQEFFPKNDFKKFYDSGLDDSGVFDPDLADRSLLYNEEHPDPKDPKHYFGVDDGEGYIEKEGDQELRWRFIGAYLIYGQWKQAVRDGIVNLANAYTLTRDATYAHKAAILLDRVADHYPNFDFKEQGILYEGPGAAGYVTTWHDACEETREMALAYDQIFEGLEGDQALVDFLSNKSKQYGLENPKDSVAQIRSNIEDRILKDALENQNKIHSNYPRKEICVAVIMTALGWPENRSEVMAYLDTMIDKATAVDGVTGEKGLANYSAFVLQSLAEFIALYTRIDDSFLSDLMERHPNLKETYRFHIDTWCGMNYYPLSGDTGWIAKDHPSYVGVIFRNQPMLVPSMYTFLHDLYLETGDPAYVQALYAANDSRVQGLPYDLFEDEPEKFQNEVERVIAQVGPTITQGSVNKTGWHLGILRSGAGENERAVWIDYDSEGGHSHRDGMNVGLFAKGLDLMTDFGYPPVQFNRWSGDRSRWYTSTFAHNTVTVDGENQKAAAGVSDFFVDGEDFRAIQVSGPEIYGVSTYTRSVFLIDIDDNNSYVLDRFLVEGGHDHTYRLHSSFGDLRYKGVNPIPEEANPIGGQMREFRVDRDPKPGWMVDWKLEDRYGILDATRDVHLRLTHLTSGCEAWFGDSWVNPGGFNTSEEAWIPTVLVRRSAGEEEDLSSEFLSILEPYVGEASVVHARKISLMGDAWTRGIEVALRGGGTDLFLFPGKGEDKRLEFNRVRLNAEMAWLRLDSDRRVEKVAFIRGTGGLVGKREIRFESATEFYEAEWTD